MSVINWIGYSPDYTDANNFDGGAEPIAGDVVIVPAGSGPIHGADKSAVALTEFRVEEGYDQVIGDRSFLSVRATTFTYAGKGRASIKINNCTDCICAPETDDLSRFFLQLSGCTNLYALRGKINTRGGVSGVAVISANAQTFLVLDGLMQDIIQFGGTVHYKGTMNVPTTIAVLGGLMIHEGSNVASEFHIGRNARIKFITRSFDDCISLGGTVDLTELEEESDTNSDTIMLSGSTLDVRRWDLDTTYGTDIPDLMRNSKLVANGQNTAFNYW